MDGFLASYWQLLRAIGTVERVLGVLLIANIVVNIGAQVFSRYLLGQPPGSRSSRSTRSSGRPSSARASA